MELVATVALQPGMEVAEDATDYKGNLLVKKDTVLDKLTIQKLVVSPIQCIQIKEPEDYVMTYFEKVKVSKDFHKFEDLYRANFTAYKVAIDSFIFKKVPPNNNDFLEIIDNIFNPLEHSRTTILDMLAVLNVPDSDILYAHGLNVALICRYTGKWFSLDDEEIKTLILCGFYYDIGKFKIPKELISKPGKLDDDEIAIMRTHPVHSYNLIQNLSLDINVKLAALMHHERCDGRGYPQKLPAERINKFAKIISIIDAYDAMTSYRAYRDPLCPFKVIEIFERDGLERYDVAYYLTFLERMVEEYIGKEVVLNDGTECSVVLINKQDLSRPMVRSGDVYIDLSREKDRYIERLI
ncbi:MAG: HD domain-containing protein [Lachnospiraceae bacterium]|nr:HD domain-containing protein [Lachnospiraceae bacterium]